MSRTTAALAVTVLALPLALLTACGTEQAASPTGAPAASSSPGSVCATADLAKPGRPSSAAGAARVPDGFVATSVVECVGETRPVAGDGVWGFMVEKRATGKIDAFVTAISKPDDPTPTPVSCDLVGHLVPWLALEDSSGRVAPVTLPTDSCGEPQEDASAALQALTFTEVSATRRDQWRTEAEVQADAAATAVGCTSLFKDMLAIIDADHAALRSAADPILASSSGVVTVCRYSAGADKDGMPLLSFVAGEKLTAAATAALQRELAASGPARACTAPHTTVTGLFTEQGGWALVETDGCHRVESGQSGGWRQATPELLALLG